MDNITFAIYSTKNEFLEYLNVFVQNHNTPDFYTGRANIIEVHEDKKIGKFVFAEIKHLKHLSKSISDPIGYLKLIETTNISQNIVTIEITIIPYSSLGFSSIRYFRVLANNICDKYTLVDSTKRSQFELPNPDNSEILSIFNIDDGLQPPNTSQDNINDVNIELFNKGSIDDLPNTILSEDFDKYSWFNDLDKMKDIFPGYSYETMKKIVESIKPAKSRFDNKRFHTNKNFSRFSSGIVADVVGYSPALVCRYLKALMTLGVKKVDDIDVPHRIKSIKSIKSI